MPGPILRRVAVLLPVLVAATLLPVLEPGPLPRLRHWAMSLDDGAPIRAPGDFGLVGVSLPPRGKAPEHALVRTSRDGKRWSEWTELEFLADDRPDADSHEPAPRNTAPLWTGINRYVDVRLPGGTRTGAKVHTIDPGPDPVTARSAAIASPSKPGIITRAQWGADEKIRKGKPSYAEPLKLALIHHTATSSSYSKSQSDDIVRSIYAYHVKTNGWDDIGYNFLVDRYGQIFEGRYGGVDRSVVGAHSLGFNKNSTGVAVIGNWLSSKPPSIAMGSLKRILAWRLDQATVDPVGSVSYRSRGSSKYPAGKVVKLKTISSHLDVGQTSCPGQPLFGALSYIRSVARKDGLPKLFGLKRSTAVVTRNGDKVTDAVKLTGRFSSAMNWRTDVLDAAGRSIYDVSGSGTSLNVNWYGKDRSGVLVPHGKYRLKVTGKGSAGSLRAYYLPIAAYRWANGTYFYTKSKASYMLEGNRLRRLSGWQARATRYRSSELVKVSNSITKYYARGPSIGFRDGSLVGAGGKTYIISDGKKRPATKGMLASKGFDTRAIIATNSKALAPHPTGSTVKPESRIPNGAALRSSTRAEGLMVGWVGRPFSSTNVRNSYVIRAIDFSQPRDSELAAGIGSEPLGFRDGTLIRAAGPSTIYMVSDGKRRPFISSAEFARMGFKSKNIRTVTPQELALHDEGKPL